LSDVEKLITRSNFITEKRKEAYLEQVFGDKLASITNKDIQDALSTGDWDERMEGLYIKWEEEGVVKGRYKFVRSSFTNSIMDQGEHWLNRPIIANQLIPGAEEKMFG
jgi:hypothetical protein